MLDAKQMATDTVLFQIGVSPLLTSVAIGLRMFSLTEHAQSCLSGRGMSEKLSAMVAVCRCSVN